jgi:uncharacterized SAM-binding protein YcdF (DUF218 family)
LNLAFAYFKSAVLVLVWPPTPFLLLSLLAWRWRQRRWAGWLLGAALLGAWLSCTEAAGEWLTRHLLQPPPALAVAELPEGPSTAVLVLGAGIREAVPEYGRPALKPLTQERLDYGVWLARQRGWPLGFTGGIGWVAQDQIHTEAEVVARVLKEQYGLGLKWAESSARDTQENAANTLPLLHKAGVRRLILVTHDAHMPRALRAFRSIAAARDIEVVPAPLGLRADAYSSIGDWVPSEGGYARVRYVVYEGLATLTGR